MHMRHLVGDIPSVENGKLSTNNFACSLLIKKKGIIANGFFWLGVLVFLDLQFGIAK